VVAQSLDEKGKSSNCNRYGNIIAKTQYFFGVGEKWGSLTSDLKSPLIATRALVLQLVCCAATRYPGAAGVHTWCVHTWCGYG
jgi:hypothetical protein